MLDFIINNKKAKIKYDVLDTYNNIQSGDSIELSVDSYINILPDDIISFYRKEGDDIEYYDEKIVKNVVFDGGEEEQNTAIFSLNSFSNINLNIVNAEYKEIDEAGFGPCYLFVFDKDIFANSVRGNVKKNVITQEDFDSLCVGDIFVRNDYLLYRKEDENINNSSLVSGKCELFWKQTNGDIIISQYGYVPCTLDGYDMKRALLFKYSQEIEDLKRNTDNFNIWVRDLRFFNYEYTDEENTLELVLKPGTKIRIRKGDPSLKISFDSDFSPYLLSNDGISQFLEEEAQKNISKTLDYEKQQFIPVVYAITGQDNHKETRVVNSICFYMHLRERDENWNVISNGKWVSYHGCGDGDRACYDDVDNVLENYDFNEEDIYYQRKCVSETFLRLSFYDSPYRGSQKLLHTAKLYLDENRLWTDYVEQIKSTNKDVKFYFLCTNKYDYNNKTEGFYLYLFPSNVKELKDGGSIYMKAELCHAKYGKTVPLTLPVYPNKDINGNIYPYNFGEGKNYKKIEQHDGRTFYSTDVDSLRNDMYIEIKIKYDAEGRRYVWYFDGANNVSDADNLEINLYEPKLL